jgi:hypothetical protein
MGKQGKGECSWNSYPGLPYRNLSQHFLPVVWGNLIRSNILECHTNFCLYVVVSEAQLEFVYFTDRECI